MLFAAVEDVYVDPLLKRWIVDLVRATRELDCVQVGASVRGSLALERAARAWALLARPALRRARRRRALFVPGDRPPLVLAPELVVETDLSRDEAARARLRGAASSARPGREPDVGRGGARGGSMSAGERAAVPARPAAALRRCAVRPPPQLAPRPGRRGRRHAAVPPGRPDRARSTGPRRPGSPRRAAPTSSSCASSSRSEAPRVALVHDRRPGWRSTRRRRRGSTSRRRRGRGRRSRRARPPSTARSALDRRRTAHAWLPPRAAGRCGQRRAPRRGDLRRARDVAERRAEALLRQSACCRPGASCSSSPTSSAAVGAPLAAPARVPLGRRAGDRPGPGLGADLPGGRRRRPSVRGPATGRSRRRGSRAERCGRSRSSTSAGSTARCGRSDTSAATRSS